MRKAVFRGSILLAALIGSVAGSGEGIGLMVVFGCIGIVAGAAIGGALTGGGRYRLKAEETPHGLTETQHQSLKNYWLDRGRLTGAPGLPHVDDCDPYSGER